MCQKRKASSNPKSWILPPCGGQGSFRAVSHQSKWTHQTERYKHIQLLFQKANNKALDEHIQEVSRNLHVKYGMFFVIPPESPTYKTPVIVVDTSSLSRIVLRNEWCTNAKERAQQACWDRRGKVLKANTVNVWKPQSCARVLFKR